VHVEFAGDHDDPALPLRSTVYVTSGFDPDGLDTADHATCATPAVGFVAMTGLGLPRVATERLPAPAPIDIKYAMAPMAPQSRSAALVAPIEIPRRALIWSPIRRR